MKTKIALFTVALAILICFASCKKKEVTVRSNPQDTTNPTPTPTPTVPIIQADTVFVMQNPGTNNTGIITGTVILVMPTSTVVGKKIAAMVVYDTSLPNGYICCAYTNNGSDVTVTAVKHVLGTNPYYIYYVTARDTLMGYADVQIQANASNGTSVYFPQIRFYVRK